MMDSTVSPETRPKPVSCGSSGAAGRSGPQAPPCSSSSDEVQPRVGANSNASLHTNGLTDLGRELPRRDRASGFAAPVWVQRLRLVVMVVFCIELGMLLAVLPWTRIWLENTLLASHTELLSLARQNFVRGVISGLGLVDIWIGIAEAVNYREIRVRK
jgi:hypothetical protein